MIEPQTLPERAPGPRRAPRRAYLLVALALIVVAVAAVVFARGVDPSDLGLRRTDPENLPAGRAAPTLAGGTGWINSPPLGPADLAGKVVVYDFWTYSCVNCVRTLPYLRAWHDRYASDGLAIVGVHSPEFDFEHTRANVEAATARLGVTWPVVQDNRKAIWDRFENQWWPAKYVADRDGRLRYTHVGEGAYEETEDVLRALLGVDAAAPRAAARDTAADAPAASANVSAETYLGLRRGLAGARPGRLTYPEPTDRLATGEVALVGAWEAYEDGVTARAAGASIVMRYRGREANLVLAPPVAGDVPTGEVVVLLDGRPLPAEYRTTDTRVSDAGATSVQVDHARLYRIALGPTVEKHELRLTVTTPGVTAFAFTFGA